MIRTRGAGLLFAAAVGLALFAGCSDGTDGGIPPGSTALPPTPSIHRVQVSGDAADAMLRAGGKVVADYGSYKLVAIDHAALATVPASVPREYRDQYNLLRLNAGTLDTTEPSSARLRQTTAPASGKALHLVQFAGPVKPEWHESLQATGARIVAYIPENAYLVYGDAAAINRIQGLASSAAEVQWDGPYLDDYKLDPTVYTQTTGAYAVQLVEDEATNSATLALVQSLQSSAGPTPTHVLGYVDLVLFADRTAIDQLAHRPDVVSIQPWFEPTQKDERQNLIISGNLTGNVPNGTSWLAWLAARGFTQSQFDASAIGIDLTDSGIDNGTQSPNHFGLYVGGNVTGTSRILYNRLVGTPNSGIIQGCDGHGTENAHIIGGYDGLTGAPFTDPAGYHYGLGVAPFVRIGSSVIFDPSSFTFPNYENLQSMAYRDGARISSNSWGSSFNSYTTDSQRYDALVRDAAPAASSNPLAGNQEMVIVFAAGNQGPSGSSVGWPATGKNVFSIAASENVQDFGGPDGCGINGTSADSAMDIASFSSRGPTSDGRKKPDLAAPGTHVSGGVAQDPGQHANPPANPNGMALNCFNGSQVCGGTAGSKFFPAGQQWYTASSGTSHSTPAVAGASALLRQYFINGGLPPPSPALNKAFFMNATRYMTGVGANDTLYSNNQGMGLMDLGVAFDGVPRLIRDEVAADMFTGSGQTRTFTGFVGNSSKPFRVTLAWTDAPGSTFGSAWNNNLDLTVTVGGNTYKGNVFSGAFSATGGAADTQNNVESVSLPAGLSGPFTVTVTATNINSDGVPNVGGALDQDFALVVYNQCGTQAATPTGTTATVNGNNRVDVSWTPNGSPSYNIYRSLTSGGPYTKLGSIAAPPFADTAVSGGATYFYIVRAQASCAESLNSNEASVTATGVCTNGPGFAGLATASGNGTSTCGNTLTWAPAQPSCGGTLSYSIYRSTTPGFVPGAGNQLTTGVTGTSFIDVNNLSSGTTYFYVVHAVEVASATIEDTNTVQRSAAPLGSVSQLYFDDFDGNRPANAAAYWDTARIGGGTPVVQLINGCHYQSPNTAWRYGSAAASCGGSYPPSELDTLTLGGNGSVAGINGFALPTGARATLTFRHWYNLEGGWDGAWLLYSTTGATGPFIQVPDSAVAGRPQITSGGYDTTIFSSPGTSAWSGFRSAANGSLSPVTVSLDALAGSTVWLRWQFSDDTVVQYEGYYLDDVALAVTNACTPVTGTPGTAAWYQLTGLPSTAGAGVSNTVTIRAMDINSRPVASYNGTATLTATDAQATLPGTVTFSGGVATATVAFGTIGPQRLNAVDNAAPTVRGTASTNVTPGAPARLGFIVQPAKTVAGVSISPAVRVTIQDAFGNQIPSASNSVTVAIGNNPGGGTLSGTVTVAAVNGVATFSNLSIDKSGPGYTLTATSAALTGATSSSFSIAPAAASTLVFQQQPTSAAVVATIKPAVTVALLDPFGNQTVSTANVTVALGANPGSGTLSGTLTVPAVAGVATFADLSLNQVGTGYTLAATSGVLTGATSASFNIAPGPANKLVFQLQPTSIVAGAPLTPSVTVVIEDKFGNLVTSATPRVTLSFGSNPGGGTFLGTTSVFAVGGVATFSVLSVDKAGFGYTLSASSTSLLSATSVAFDVSSGAASRLTFTQQPSNTGAGASLNPAVTVTISDAYGNVTTASTASVTVGLNPTGTPLSGTTTVNAVNGVATFNDLSVNRAGNGYTLAASSTGLTSATSAAFAITAAAPAALAFSVQPTNTVAGGAISPAVQVAILDAFGNATSATDAVTVAIGSNPASGTLSGTTTVAAINGTASFSGLSLNKAGSGYTLVASGGALTGATSNPLNVTPGAPATLAFTVQPSNTTSGAAIAPAVTVQVLDANGNAVPTATSVLTLTLAANPSGGVLAGTTTVAASGGVATFSGLSIAKAGAGYSLSASFSGIVGAVSSTFDVAAGAPSALVFGVQPSNTTAGVAIAPAATVRVLDAAGNLVDTATTSITVALGNNLGSATLGGTTTVAATNGIATFSGLSLNKSGAGYMLNASAMGLASTSSSAFNVSAAAPASLAFSVQPASAAAGAAISPAVQVAVLDAFGNLTTATDSITVALGTNPSAGTLSGTTTVAAINGVASFSGLSINKSGTGYTLTAAAGALTGATSNAFNLTPGPAAALVFTAQPTHTSAGATLIPAVAVKAVDAFGNDVPSSTPSVTVDLGANPTGATLAGTLTQTATAGTASFANLSVARAGTGYTLSASAPGLSSATSAAFNVTVGAAASLAFGVEPSLTAAGAFIAPVVTVRILDAVGNVVPTASTPVSIALGHNPSSATLSGTATANASSGVATFPGLSIDKTGTGYALAASATGLTGATSVPFDVAATTPARLVFTVQPANTVAGATLVAVKVAAQDNLGNVNTGFTGSVTVALSDSNGATLGGTATVNTVNGVAVFSTLKIAKAGTGYTLTATTANLNSATSSAFAVTPGAASRLVLSGLPASVTALTAASFTLTAQDDQGNVATAYAGSVNVTSSDTEATLPPAPTFTSGVAANVPITFKTVGSQTVTARDVAAASISDTGSTHVTAVPQPTVSITAPTDGSRVSGTVTITAAGAVDSRTSLTKIEIFVDGASVGSGTSSPVSVSWDSAMAKADAHALTAVITDGVGNSVTSAAVNVRTARKGCGCGATDSPLGTGLFGLALFAWQVLRRRRRS